MTRLGVVSWNTNRVGGDRLQECVQELVGKVGRRVLLLQEVSAWPEDPHLMGWQIFHGAESYSAVLVPSELQSQIRRRQNSSHTSAALLGELGVMAAYFADSGKSYEEFEGTVHLVCHELRQLRAAGAKYLVIGCDAQVELPPGVDGITGPDARGCAQPPAVRSDRVFLMLTLSQEFGLKAASTWTETSRENPCTRRPWGRQVVSSQLDYVFTSRSLCSKTGVANRSQCMSSDHYPVWASVDGRDFKLKTRVRQISVTGWQPCREIDVERFKAEVLRKLGLQHGTPTYGHLPDMSAVQEHILEAALAVSFTTKPMRKREHFAKPPQLAAAEEASKRAPAGPQEAACRKLERQLRRRWGAKLVDLELSDKVKQTKVQGLHSLECHGIRSSDRLRWMKELESHCLQKYYIPYETSAVQHARIQALRSVQAASELDGRRAPELTPGVVLLARGRMATGKAPGVDRIVVEMLHLLPVTFVYVIASIFARRYSGECVESVDSWARILMVFLAKVPRLRSLLGIGASPYSRS